MRPAFALAFAVALVLGLGCSSEPQGGDAGADAGIDQALADRAVGDRSMDDQAMIDQSMIDQSMIDQSMIDQAVVDLAMADLTMLPDLTPPRDLVTLPDLRPPPDLVMLPDLIPPPDLVMLPDLTPPPDLAIPPDLVLADLVTPPVVVVPLAGVTVATIAGSSTAGHDDGAGNVATFSNPTGIALEPAGSLIVADYDDAHLRRVQPDGATSTLLASQAGFAQPFGVAVLADGTLYVQTDADSTGAKNASSGTLWQVSGLGVATVVLGMQGRPRGIFATGASQLAVSDRSRDTVSLFDTGTKLLSPLAGTINMAGLVDAQGPAARFNSPIGVAQLPGGALVVADWLNNAIRQVAPDGTVTTLGGDGVPGMIDGPTNQVVRFAGPRAVAADAAGNIYVCDNDNHRVRRIAGGMVVTVAGDGTLGWMDGAGTVAELYGQEGIVVSADGMTLYLTDGNYGNGTPYHRIRAITLP